MTNPRTSEARAEADERYGHDASSKRASAFVAGAEWAEARAAERYEALVAIAREMVSNGIAVKLNDTTVDWCIECWNRWAEEHEDDCTTGKFVSALTQLGSPQAEEHHESGLQRLRAAIMTEEDTE